MKIILTSIMVAALALAGATASAISIQIDRQASARIPGSTVAFDVRWGMIAPPSPVGARDYVPFDDTYGTLANASDRGTFLRVSGNDRFRVGFWDFHLPFGSDRSVLNLDFSDLAIFDYRAWQVTPLTDGDIYGARFVYGPGGGFRPDLVQIPDSGGTALPLCGSVAALALLRSRLRHWQNTAILS
jgi:hypothetical protein